MLIFNYIYYRNINICFFSPQNYLLMRLSLCAIVNRQQPTEYDTNWNLFGAKMATKLMLWRWTAKNSERPHIQNFPFWRNEQYTLYRRGYLKPWSSFGLANYCRLWSRCDEQNKFMNFVIIMDCCQVFGASVSGSTKQTKFLFATWPSHNYLLIVYIMLMVSPASHLCVCLIFCLDLFYSSSAKLLFPNSDKFWFVWTERRNNDARSKKKWNVVRNLTASAMAATVCSSSWFFLLDVTWAEQIALATHRDLCRLFIHVNACVALQYSIEILLCTLCLAVVDAGWWVRECVCAAKRKQQIRFVEFKNKHWE